MVDFGQTQNRFEFKLIIETQIVFIIYINKKFFIKKQNIYAFEINPHEQNMRKLYFSDNQNQR